VWNTYSATDAANHVGETATVTDRVDGISTIVVVAVIISEFWNLVAPLLERASCVLACLAS
jgi:hypothetical protein